MARGEGLRPDALVRAAGDRGLAGLLLPVEHGGAGATHLEFARFVEAVARVCASSAVILDVHLSVGSEPLLLFGTARAAAAPPARRSRRVATPRRSRSPSRAAAATRPALSTRAERDGDGYRLTGTKAFITNCGAADVYLVMARTAAGRQGITAFIVEAGSPGLHAPARRCTRWASPVRGPPSSSSTASASRPPTASATRAWAFESPWRRSTAAASASARRRWASPRAASTTWSSRPPRRDVDVDQTLLADIHARTVAARLLTAHAARLADCRPADDARGLRRQAVRDRHVCRRGDRRCRALRTRERDATTTPARSACATPRRARSTRAPTRCSAWSSPGRCSAGRPGVRARRA